MGNRVGQYIDDYCLVRRLGAGACGEVYLGEHVLDHSQVAVKVLHLSQEHLKSFIQEASATFRLKHPHIVQLRSFGISADDTPYLIMDYAPNGTLRDRHPKGTRLPVDTMLSYLLPLASALQYAHDRRVVHRDVKPENALLGPEHEVLLGDFGIAVIAPVERSLSTQNLGGTAPYMAPEQIHGKPQPASDQYALAVMVYEWLCGVHPFEGNQWAIFAQHLSSSPPSLRESRPDLPLRIEEILFKALSKYPQERFARVQDFALALKTACEEAVAQPRPVFDARSQWQNDRPVVATQVISAAPLAQPPLVPTHTSQGQASFTHSTEQPHRRIPRRTAVLALAGLVGIGGVSSAFAWRTYLQSPYLFSPLTPTSPVTTPASSPVTPVLGTTLYVYHSKNGSYALAWSPNGQALASASDVGTVQVWNATNGEVRSTFRHPAAAAIFTIGWSPNGKLIAFSGLGESVVDVWDATTGQPVLTYQSRSGASALAWSPDSSLLASGGTAVEVWEATTGKLVSSYPEIAGAGNLTSVKWSPDGKRLAAGYLGNVALIWDTRTGNLVLTYPSHTQGIMDVAWSPSGEWIASGGSDGTVHVWNASTGSRINTYAGHSKTVEGVAWSPNGKRIASASDDGTVHLWDALTGEHVYVYRGHTSFVSHALWSPDGGRIASVSGDETVRVWTAG